MCHGPRVCRHPHACPHAHSINKRKIETGSPSLCWSPRLKLFSGTADECCCAFPRGRLHLLSPSHHSMKCSTPRKTDTRCNLRWVLCVPPLFPRDDIPVSMEVTVSYVDSVAVCTFTGLCSSQPSAWSFPTFHPSPSTPPHPHPHRRISI